MHCTAGRKKPTTPSHTHTTPDKLIMKGAVGRIPPKNKLQHWFNPSTTTSCTQICTQNSWMLLVAVVRGICSTQVRSANQALGTTEKQRPKQWFSYSYHIYSWSTHILSTVCTVLTHTSQKRLNRHGKFSKMTSQDDQSIWGIYPIYLPWSYAHPWSSTLGHSQDQHIELYGSLVWHSAAAPTILLLPVLY